jgi:hypothetical protein
MAQVPQTFFHLLYSSPITDNGICAENVSLQQKIRSGRLCAFVVWRINSERRFLERGFALGTSFTPDACQTQFGVTKNPESKYCGDLPPAQLTGLEPP